MFPLDKSFVQCMTLKAQQVVNDLGETACRVFHCPMLHLHSRYPGFASFPFDDGLQVCAQITPVLRRMANRKAVSAQKHATPLQPRKLGGPASSRHGGDNHIFVGEILLWQPRLRHLSLDECRRHSKNYRMCGLLPDSLLRPSSECDRSRLCRKAHHLEKPNCFRGLSSLSSCQHAG